MSASWGRGESVWEDCEPGIIVAYVKSEKTAPVNGAEGRKLWAPTEAGDVGRAKYYYSLILRAADSHWKTLLKK